MNTETTGKLDTPLGIMDYHITCADHVYISCSDSTIKVNKVEYKVGCHLFLVNGVWTAKKNSTGNFEIYMTRPLNYSQGASYPAIKKTAEILTKSWNDFISNRQHLLLSAKRNDLKAHINGLNTKIKDHKIVLERLMLDLQKSEEELEKL